MAQSGSQAAELWALREGISESLSATGFPHKERRRAAGRQAGDLLPRSRALFLQRYQGWEVCLFGHIGDGNLHINVMKPDSLDKATFLEKTKEADHDVFALIKAHQGTISAEHGIGLLKKDYLGYCRSPRRSRSCARSSEHSTRETC